MVSIVSQIVHSGPDIEYCVLIVTDDGGICWHLTPTPFHSLPSNHSPRQLLQATTTASFVKIFLLATASIAAAAKLNASASIGASVDIDASNNIDVDLDISVEAFRIEDLAEQCDVPANAMVNLLNTDNFTTIKVEDWTTILQQSAEIVETWPAPIK
ncbi:hypothetical protein G6011_00517 [Alternaria panax]|uniref:Uncharacterized protein n=1 Tax=Alternaria panax TaxID=48097 RepID=A0AAD4NTQ0_9PLEO|nr:hypothetical protein G6011_00517 [Alternaria panax]